jgi:hypothetical protein
MQDRYASILTWWHSVRALIGADCNSKTNEVACSLVASLLKPAHISVETIMPVALVHLVLHGGSAWESQLSVYGIRALRAYHPGEQAPQQQRHTRPRGVG